MHAKYAWAWASIICRKLQWLVTSYVPMNESIELSLKPNCSRSHHVGGKKSIAKNEVNRIKHALVVRVSMWILFNGPKSWVSVRMISGMKCPMVITFTQFRIVSLRHRIIDIFLGRVAVAKKNGHIEIYCACAILSDETFVRRFHCFLLQKSNYVDM